MFSVRRLYTLQFFCTVFGTQVVLGHQCLFVRVFEHLASRVNNTSELYLCGRSERISKSLPFHGCIYMNVCEQHMVDMGKL